MNADTIEITFLRHGRSTADDEGKYEGRYDSPLTDAGKVQALARGESWRNSGVVFDGVICSTLKRAISTAEIVAGCLDLEIELDPDWMEVDIGGLCGLTFEEGQRRFPKPVFRGPYDPIAGGESEIQLHARAARAVEKIVRRGPGHWLVVAHGGSINAALRTITGIPFPINGHGVWFHLGDLGYTRLRYQPARHHWMILELAQGIVL